MNTVKGLSLLMFGLLLPRFSASAGEELQFMFRGTAYQTNGAGAIFTTPVTEQAMLQDVAAAAGITDLSGLALAYHVQANGMGDTVDVINPANGAVLDTLLGFYFSDAFGRRALTNRTGTVDKRIQYVYTKQNDHSLGGGLVTKSMVRDRSGNMHPGFQGTLHYLITPGGNTGTKVYNGTFTTGKVLFPGMP